jgi:hypothetical protein
MNTTKPQLTHSKASMPALMANIAPSSVFNQLKFCRLVDVAKLHCWDNAVMERFFRSLKIQRLNCQSFENHHEGEKINRFLLE